MVPRTRLDVGPRTVSLDWLPDRHRRMVLGQTSGRVCLPVVSVPKPRTEISPLPDRGSRIPKPKECSSCPPQRGSDTPKFPWTGPDTDETPSRLRLHTGTVDEYWGL